MTIIRLYFAGIYDNTAILSRIFLRRARVLTHTLLLPVRVDIPPCLSVCMWEFMPRYEPLRKSYCPYPAYGRMAPVIIMILAQFPYCLIFLCARERNRIKYVPPSSVFDGS